MDFQTIINLVGGTALGVAGWFARALWSAVQDLQRELASHKESVPKEYVSKSDFSRDMDEIRGMFREIRNTLNAKADK